MTTPTLAEFLLERIAEDEAAARDALEVGTYPHFGDTAAEECLEMAEGEGCSSLGVDYFRRVLPVRVLAECAAKRRIVENCVDGLGEETTMPYGGSSGLASDVLRLLALPYADHPDYRAEWRP